jgi:hypothetical protein
LFEERPKLSSQHKLAKPVEIPSALEIESRLRNTQATVFDLSAQMEGLQQARELCKASDPNITIEILNDFSRRETALDHQIKDLMELERAQKVHLNDARHHEWRARKAKRKAEVQSEHAKADSLYAESAQLWNALKKNLTEMRALHLRGVNFNQTSDPSVGYVELAETRIRHTEAGGDRRYAARPRPLWEELSKIPGVYPGESASAINLPSTLPLEEPAPKPLSLESSSTAPVPRGPGSAVRTVHRTSSEA